MKSCPANELRRDSDGDTRYLLDEANRLEGNGS